MRFTTLLRLADQKGLTIVEDVDHGSVRISKSPNGVAITRFEDGSISRSDRGIDLTICCDMRVKDAARALGLTTA